MTSLVTRNKARATYSFTQTGNPNHQVYAMGISSEPSIIFIPSLVEEVVKRIVKGSGRQLGRRLGRRDHASQKVEVRVGYYVVYGRLLCESRVVGGTDRTVQINLVGRQDDVRSWKRCGISRAASVRVCDDVMLVASSHSKRSRRSTDLKVGRIPNRASRGWADFASCVLRLVSRGGCQNCRQRYRMRASSTQRSPKRNKRGQRPGKG